MAKAKSGKGKKLNIVIGIILLVAVVMIIVSTVVSKNRSNANASAQGTFYIEVNGSRYYEGGEITLKRSSITTFKCGYAGNVQSADKLYNVKITSAATDETTFTYTLNGATRKFLDGEDYTHYFDVTESTDRFEIAHQNDTPATVLQRRFAGKTVVTPETDPTISYFTLTISSADGSQSVAFALTFENTEIKLDPDDGIIF